MENVNPCSGVLNVLNRGVRLPVPRTFKTGSNYIHYGRIITFIQ